MAYKKILITGITGLIGSHTAILLKQKGYEVTGLVRNIESAKQNKFLQNIPLIIGDVTDVYSLDDMIGNFDVVVHCAGFVSFAPKDEKLLRQINIDGTANVVNVCLEKGVKKLIHISSIAALGLPKTPEVKLLNEQNDWFEDSKLSNYARSKFGGEMEVWRGIAEGQNAVIINPSVVLGEGDWNQTSTKLFKYVADQNKFYTLGKLNYVDVKDVSEIIAKAIESDVNEERFILSAGEISIKNFFEKVAAKMNKKAPSVLVSPFWAQIIWRIEWLRSWITGSNPLITKETSQSAKRNYSFDNSKAKKQFDFEFTDLEKTLERIIPYFG